MLTAVPRNVKASSVVPVGLISWTGSVNFHGAPFMAPALFAPPSGPLTVDMSAATASGRALGVAAIWLSVKLASAHISRTRASLGAS